MSARAATADGELSKTRRARRLVDRLVDALIAAHPDGGGLEIGVLGHSGDSAEPVPLLLDATADPFLRPLSELARQTVRRRPDGSSRWVRPERSAGEPPAVQGLGYAYRLVQRWLQQHPGGAAPLVVYCTDGEGSDEASASAARSLQALEGASSNTLLFHCLFSKRYPGQLAEPAALPPNASPGRELWELSSPLPGQASIGPPARALTINAAPVDLLCRLAGELTRSTPVFPLDADTGAVPAPRCLTHMLRLEKLGNSEAEWEDAADLDLPRGAFAVADGASEGIFARAWASLLTTEYVRCQVDLTDAAARASWLQGCRRAWVRHINYPTLRWSQQNKVDSTGAAATFLALTLTEAPGPGEEPIVWRAWAVGDSCLFWVRDNRLHATFPVRSARDFGLTPALLGTRTHRPDPVPLAARGRCRPGDLFLLATDAVAQWLLHGCEQDRQLDWQRYLTLDEQTWRAEMADLRGAGEIVNDDCTVLAAGILPAAPG
jgi:hypothetical protein